MIIQKGYQDIKPKTERKLFLYLPQTDGTWLSSEEYNQHAEDMVRSPEWEKLPYRIMEETTTTEYRIIKEQK